MSGRRSSAYALVQQCASRQRVEVADDDSAFEDAREDVARFVGGRPGDTVVFVRNTTEAINVLRPGLPPRSQVLTTPVEHHSNMLPWRRHDVRTLPFTRSAEELLEAWVDAAAGSPPTSICLR